jgi:hypothetical protein
VARIVSPVKRNAVSKSEITTISLGMNRKSPSRANANGTRMENISHLENTVL